MRYLIGIVTVQYGTVCDKLREAIDLHPPREKPNWGTDSTFTSAEAAAIVREAGIADAKGLILLQEIVDTLP